MKLIALASAAILAAAGLALTQPDKAPTKPTEKQPAPKAGAAERVGDPYPLATCPISGEKLGAMGAPVVKVYGAEGGAAGGREIQFCCKNCPPKFEKDLPANLAKLDEQMIKDQLPLYPLTTSVVSGEKLPDKPVDFIFGNRLIRVSSEAEKAAFAKDWQKHLKTLDEATIAAQSKNYPLTKCPVSHDSLGEMGDPVNIVVAGRLIRLCCKDCKKDINESPAQFIAAVDEARKAKK
jgi:hypothetical protein